MRKIVVSANVTLDGCIEGRDGDLSWMQLGPRVWDEVKRLMDGSDAVLFGRIAYEGFAQYWPAAGQNPDSPPDEIEFSRWIDDIPKYVATTTLREASWKNTHVIRDDVPAAIGALKNQPGRNILVFGGGGIISTLTKHALADEYHIHVFPLVLGGGRPLFRDVDARREMRLESTGDLGDGVIALRYECVQA